MNVAEVVGNDANAGVLGCGQEQGLEQGREGAQGQEAVVVVVLLLLLLGWVLQELLLAHVRAHPNLQLLRNLCISETRLLQTGERMQHRSCAVAAVAEQEHL
jgi:hypothetical protein